MSNLTAQTVGLTALLQVMAFGKVIDIPENEVTWEINDKEAGANWHPRYRTRHILEQFDPSQGWAINVTAEYAGFDMDGFTKFARDQPMPGSNALFPAYVFRAELINPDGKVVARASSLRIINGLNAYEEGENNARSRLYEALGLRGFYAIPLTDVPDAVRERMPAERPATSGSPAQTQPDTATPASSTDPMAGITPVTGEEGRFSKRYEQVEAPVLEDEPSPATETDTAPISKAEQSEASAEPAPAATTEPIAAVAGTVPETDPEAAPAVADGKAARKAQPPKAATLNSIRSTCQRRNIEMPELKTQEEAAEFLLKLTRPASPTAITVA